jgi:hypothetical protein
LLIENFLQQEERFCCSALKIGVLFHEVPQQHISLPGGFIMPITYRIDTDSQIICVAIFGDVLADDLVALGEGLATANLLNHPYLVDARSANLELTTNEVRNLVELTHRLLKGLPPTPVAFVTDRSSLFGMVRMYQIMTSDIHPGFAVFKDYLDARDWLQM